MAIPTKNLLSPKMYLCHSKELILKDTESLGNNKAPACESRGFVRKRKKGCILTHLPQFMKRFWVIISY